MLSRDAMRVDVTWLQQSVQGWTVVQGACEKNSSVKKIVVMDEFKLTPSKIMSNTQCLETVYQNKIWMCFPPFILQKL
jgi:hypothetical protein